MGLLDDLRKQSQGQQAKEQDEKAREAARQQFYNDEMLPRLREAYQYFSEFAQHLNYLQVHTLAEYPLMPDGAPVTLQQTNYRVLVDSNETMGQIDLKIDAELEQPVEFEMHGKEAILRHSDRLDRYFIAYKRQDGKDERMELVKAKFIIEGPLPLGLTLYADIEQGRFRVVARNFSEPGRSVYNLSTQALDAEMLDRMGRYVLRESDQFMELGMSDDARASIRRKLEYEQAQRQREMEEAEQAAAEVEDAERKRDIRGNLINSSEKIKQQVNENRKRIGEMLEKLKQARRFDKP